IQVHDEHVEITIVIEVAKGTAAACMHGPDPRTSQVQQFFEFPVAQIAEHNALALERITRHRLLNLGIYTAGYPEQVRIAVVIDIEHTRSPTDVAGLHAQA